MKKMTQAMAAVGAVLLVSAAGARAGDWINNLYLNADVGGIFQQDADFHQTTAPTYNASFNPGIRGDLAIGYNLSQSFALEFEPGFMWNSLDALNGYALSRSGESIDIYSVPLLANLVFKFPSYGAWTPYVGVGVGGNVGTMDGKLPYGNFTDTDVTFAFQGEAGLKYRLCDHASVGLAYKFIGTTDQDYDLRTGVNYTDHITIGGVYIHGVYASLTWNF